MDMISKDDAVQALIKKGYEAVNANGVVVVHCFASEMSETSAAVKEFLKNIGYKSSWGITGKKDKVIMDELHNDSFSMLDDGQMSFL